jgi:hypothetical protein
MPCVTNDSHIGPAISLALAIAVEVPNGAHVYPPFAS